MMEKKLKNLEDLQVYKRVKFPSTIDNKEYVDKVEVKDLAIKWVKRWRKTRNCGLLIEFHNISDEDLK